MNKCPHFRSSFSEDMGFGRCHVRPCVDGGYFACYDGGKSTNKWKKCGEYKKHKRKKIKKILEQ